MRLLNTTTRRLEEFTEELPRYAILSHTWGNDEVLFKDVESGIAHGKRGYDKVEGFCNLAAVEGFTYCWIDTCSIDKSSSAELSEAINSMFSYYQDSDACYVYLDVKIQGDRVTLTELRNTRWITRGWTLQELIAPSNVSFFDKKWKLCGTRSELVIELHSITGIGLEPLSGVDLTMLQNYSIATKMSWASKRITTRPEDLAYCLFGIFQVHLPPLYGEGRLAAFRRLQEEIIKYSLDLSFLAWTAKALDNRYCYSAGGLATCPEDFANFTIVKRKSAPKLKPFHMTNKGLCLTLPVVQLTDEVPHFYGSQSEYIMILSNCSSIGDPGRSCVGVRIWRVDGEDVFRRAESSDVTNPDVVSVPYTFAHQARVLTFSLDTTSEERLISRAVRFDDPVTLDLHPTFSDGLS